MLQELITVKNTPAIITVNFDELKKALAAELEKYDILVTTETLSDAKKLATELNKTKSVIDTRRKEEVAKASEPVKKFDNDMKELVTMCSDGRQKILDQVKRFEDETKQLVATQLSGARDFLFDKHGVKPEFMRAEYDDLIKLTAITTTGKLTKGVKDDLTRRVMDDLRIQDRTASRLLQLENQSFKAGLAAPLTEDHVKPFLFADDDHYASEINRIIDAEVIRQEQAERRIKEQMEAKAARDKAAEEAKAKPVAEPEPAPEPIAATVAPEPEPQPEPAPEQVQAAPGKVNCVVTCTFEVEVGAGVTEAAIEAELRKVMAKAGISSLKSVHVQKHNPAVAA